METIQLPVFGPVTLSVVDGDVVVSAERMQGTITVKDLGPGAVLRRMVDRTPGYRLVADDEAVLAHALYAMQAVEGVP